MEKAQYQLDGSGFSCTIGSQESYNFPAFTDREILSRIFLLRIALVRFSYAAAPYYIPSLNLPDLDNCEVLLN